MPDQGSIRTQMEAHVRWKSSLREDIRGGTSALVLPEEDRCALSELLYDQEGRILHKQFHDAAAEILALAKAGNREGAMEKMATGSMFAMSLSALGRALHALRTQT